VWLKGEIKTKFKYMAMFANNLSTLGVSAAQLDNNFDTQSYMLQWAADDGRVWTVRDVWRLRLSRERGGARRRPLHAQPRGQAVAAGNRRHREQSDPFDLTAAASSRPNLFAPGTTVNQVDYQMMSIDAGWKYKGLSFEGEYYRRWLGDYAGLNTALVPDISDNGYQMQISAMAVPKVLQLYTSWSQIFGDYGDPSEFRVGENWYFMKTRGLRVNGEFMHVNGSPVGYTAYPYPVGARGSVFHINLEMNF
jgi:hypothetical protein